MANNLQTALALKALDLRAQPAAAALTDQQLPPTPKGLFCPENWSPLSWNLGGCWPHLSIWQKRACKPFIYLASTPQAALRRSRRQYGYGQSNYRTLPGEGILGCLLPALPTDGKWKRKGNPWPEQHSDMTQEYLDSSQLPLKAYQGSSNSASDLESWVMCQTSTPCKDSLGANLDRQCMLCLKMTVNGPPIDQYSCMEGSAARLL